MGRRSRIVALFSVYTVPITRHDFVLSSAAAVTVASAAPEPAEDAARGRRLLKGWEHYRGQLGGVWEVWPGDKASDNVAWQPVELPHCFNARDAVDPDDAYYQSPGWYRTNIAMANPFSNGRTLLEFEGAGQKTEVWAGKTRLGRHVGGYDEWTVDFLRQLARSGNDPVEPQRFQPVGGLYRYMNLRYVPAISIERVHVHDGVVSARLYNPAAMKNDVSLDVA